MSKLLHLITNGGSPTQLSGMWDETTADIIAALCQQTIRHAQHELHLGPEAAVRRTMLGLYAHAFLVGREHVKSGLILPGAVRGPSAITAEDVAGIVIPDDLSGL